MAITTATTRMSAGINYTIITSGATDWTGVSNSTYFYDLIDKLPHYKDGSGNILEVFSSGGGGGTTFTGGTVAGATNFTNGLTANTISATTYQGLPLDIRITGGTYSSGTATFTNNTGGTFTISGFNTTISPISIVNTSSLFSTGLSGTGVGASGVTNSLFLGDSAGSGATYGDNSTFIGYQAGKGGVYSSDSNFIGYNAGLNAIGGGMSNFFGTSAGQYATYAGQSNFFGRGAGYEAINANQSNFFGAFAGNGATNANKSNFLGTSAGYEAINANNSNFLGNGAGYGAANAIESNFIGSGVGGNATNASGSTFIGTNSGNQATNADNSNFIGYQAGYLATGASYSNIFGYKAGRASSQANSIGSNNIIIGTNITLSAGTANSVNIGGVLFGTGTYSTTTGNPIISATTGGRIGIGVVNPLTTLHVVGDTLIQGNLTANTVSATTYYNLPTSTDIRVTGGTYSSGTATFTNNTGGTFTVTGFSTGGGGGSSTDTYLTGATYTNNTFTFTNNTGGTFSTLFNTMTGLTISGNLTVTGGTQSLFSGSSSVEMVKIIQAGSGDAFVVQDQANGDASHFVINASGNTAIGLTQPIGNDKLTVSGNTNIYGGLTATTISSTSGIFSGSGQNVLTVIGSGNSSTSPIFSIQGSQGELFSVTDSLTGSLFSVNDISGLPILEVFSDNTTLMGSYQAPSLNTTTKVTLTAGTNNIYSIPTSAYTGAFFDYTVISSGSTGARAGNIMAIWSGTTTQYSETSTNDIGNTAGITFSVAVSGNNAVLSSSATTGGWTLKTIIRTI